MPRRARTLVGGYAYHVLNRANGRLRLFRKDDDYAAFERIVQETVERVPLRILGYVVMPNHWHFVVWPRRDEGPLVSDFFRRLTVTHTQRLHAHLGTAGQGHIYQGRFKSFPIEADEHLLTVLRYVERNPLRAGLVERAEQWRWGSLPLRSADKRNAQSLLTASPVPLGRAWSDHVNRPQTEAELEALRVSIRRGRPYGDDAWREKMVECLGLEHTIRPRGRPRRKPDTETDSSPKTPQ